MCIRDRDGSLSMDLIPASPRHRAIINYLVIKRNVRARQAGN